MNRIKTFAAKIGANKFFMMVVSVLIAFIIWLYVVNDQNGDIRKEFTAVPIVYTGETSLLEERSLIVTGIGTNSVTLELYGKRSIVAHLDKNEIQVSVDLTTIRASGPAVTVPTTVTLPEGVTLVSRDPEFVNVSVEGIVSKSIPIRGNLEGSSVSEGYIKENPKFTPTTLTVRGPSSRVAEVDHALVNIVYENLNETVSTTVQPELRGADGQLIDMEGLTLDYNSVNVELPVKMLKEVGLSVNLVAGGGAEVGNAVVEIKPSTIQLKGEAAAFSELNNQLIIIDNIDLSTVSGKITKNVPIRIPDGMETLSGEQTAEVTVTIVGLSTSARIASTFAAANKAPGYSVRFITNNLYVTVRGPADELEGILDSSIIVTCDVSDIARTPGVHELDMENITVSITGAKKSGVIRNFGRVSVEIIEE